jgi:FixJ family two-component response regulator
MQVRQRIQSLTRREYQVFTWMIQGKSTRQMAHDTGRREGTIKLHRGRIMKKMQAHSLVELTRMGERIRLSEELEQSLINVAKTGVSF